MNPDEERLRNDKIRPINRYERLVLFKRRKFTKQDIELAIKNTKSANAAARFLGIAFNTFKKAASQYVNENGITLFDSCKNPSGIGIKKYPANDRKTYKTDDILAGKYPGYSIARLKNRLIQEVYLPEKCAHCGFCERRIVDNKIPLLLNCINNDLKDLRAENLELLCYNCYFLLVGTPFNPYLTYKRKRLLDPSKLDLGERNLQAS